MDLIWWPAYKNAIGKSKGHFEPKTHHPICGGGRGSLGEGPAFRNFSPRSVIRPGPDSSRTAAPAVPFRPCPASAHDSSAAHLRRALQGNDSGLSAERLGVWNAGCPATVASQHWLHGVYLRSFGKVSRRPV